MTFLTEISKCPFVGPCVVSLVIHHQSDVIELFTNFTARYNGYIYTVHQVSMYKILHLPFFVVLGKTKIKRKKKKTCNSEYIFIIVLNDFSKFFLFLKYSPV